MVIHHIDENKGNPILSNLEIVTLSENHILSPRVSNQNNWGKSIIQLDLDGNFVAQYSSASVAAKAIKGGRSHISRCANGKFSKMYGYRWKFKNEENLENEIWKQIEIDGKIIQISKIF